MKLLIFILIFSCTKIERRSLQENTSPKSYSSALFVDTKISHKIDLMVAFLWPQLITRPDQKLAIKRVISDSRSLKKQKEEYLFRRSLLRKVYNENDCPCLLENRCSYKYVDLEPEKCYDIEEELYQNDRALIAIYKTVETIRTNVENMGGLWLATHLDFPELPTSSFDFESLKINFSVFGIDNEGRPLSSTAKKISVEDFGNSQQLTFFMKHSLSRGNWKVVVSSSSSPNSLLFQGELYFDDGTHTRQGIIYWEHSLNEPEAVLTSNSDQNSI